ncbi:MAG: hypothetical protein EA396_06310 [Anaerolineaceae bacterium]|nr:MAG: hypothetical protein EA396_06310 [Anaerolineaceae bacterium]
MRYLFVIYFIVCCFGLTGGSSFAQSDDLRDTLDARFESDLTTPYIGEPFTLQLTVEHPPHIRLIEWPAIEGDWDAFEVQEIDAIITEELANGDTRYTQTFQVTIWTTGDHVTPPTVVLYQREGETQILRARVTDVFFSVFSVLPTQDLNQLFLFPNRSPVGFFYLPVWVYVIMMAMVGGALWGGRRFLRGRRARRAARLSALKRLSPLAEALKILESASLQTGTRQKIDTLRDSIRVYIRRLWRIETEVLTDDELLIVLKDMKLLPQSDLDDLGSILRKLETARYAGVGVDNAMLEQATEHIRRWLVRSDEYVKGRDER